VHTGSLFEYRFHRKPVESQSFLLQLVRYIHHKPMHHGMIADFRLWLYSSYRAILGKESTSLPREEVLYWFRGREGFEEFHR
jgi:putative transposase